MWQRFTERARKVIFYAQEEAGKLGENYVSTEHLLLGLIRENDSVAARILDRLGVGLGRIRSEIERQVARGDAKPGPDMQLTPRAKRVVDLAYDEAKTLNNNYIGTEHLLLGLIREGDGLAGRILTKLGVDLDRTRSEVRHLQEGGREQEGAGAPSPQTRLMDVLRSDLAVLTERFLEAGSEVMAHLSPPDPAIENIANALLAQAVREQATDVCLWPEAVTLRVDYAISGQWRQAALMAKYLLSPLIAWFRENAAPEGAPRSTFWHGASRAPVAVDGKNYDFDVSILSYTEGERIAVALFPADD